MKKLPLVILILMTLDANAQYWQPPGSAGAWVKLTKKIDTGECGMLWEVKGGVPTNHLDILGFYDMADGAPDGGYFQFSGEIEDSPMGPIKVLMWPPGLFSQGLVGPERNNWHFEDCYPAISGCFGALGSPSQDTAFPLEGFGFCYNNPAEPYGIWLINDGYAVTDYTAVMTWSQPCPPWEEMQPKVKVFFTDSEYVPLADECHLSGDSPLFIEAICHYQATELEARLYLKTSPGSYKVVDLEQTGVDSIWHGSYSSSRELGLKSYNQAEVLLEFAGKTDTDEVDVCLPKIRLQVNGVYTNTVFIRSDSMKIAHDVKVSLYFENDADGAKVAPTDVIDSVGYKYKSRWIGSEDVWNEQVRLDTFYRAYPAESLIYKWWNKIAPNYEYVFSRDSLYVVGGELTIACKGALKPVPNINNSFSVDTDTLSPYGFNVLKTKRILIDRDPSNALFLDSLEHDIIKAIAWQEYAGSNDFRRCHNPQYNPRYNNYWDDRITGADTCRDRKTPCENIWSSATGTMQMLRYTWQSAFNSPNYIPQGYYRAKWDSLAWNWKINVFNGKFIYFKDNFFRLNNNEEQREWDSTCTCASSDTIPESPNKEDLAVYGYTYGFYGQDSLTANNWKDVMESAAGYYVRAVRRFKDDQPWNR